MIKLITGLPGNGKSLYLIEYLFLLNKKKDLDIKKNKVDEKADYNREIRVYGIDHLEVSKLHLLSITLCKYDDLKNWENHKDTIFIVDEAQDVVPMRNNKTALPDFINNFSKHRHLGNDFFFVTQNPMMIDIHIRRLVQEHTNVKRLFSTNYLLYYKWDHVVSDPRDYIERKFSSKKITRIKKKYFSLYKSASSHTHKSSIPIFMIVGFVFILIFFLVFYYIYKNKDNVLTKPVSTASSHSPKEQKTKKQINKNHSQTKKPLIKNLNYFNSDIKFCHINGFVGDTQLITLHYRDGSYIASNHKVLQKNGISLLKISKKDWRCRDYFNLTTRLPVLVSNNKSNNKNKVFGAGK